MKRTLNASEMKMRNRAAILKLIRQGGYSRAEISRLTGLTRPAVTVIIDACLEQGVIEEGEKNDSAIGRKSVGLKWNASYGWMIGLNISRRAFTIGIVDFAGNICKEFRKEISAKMAPEGVLEEICLKIDELKENMSGRFLGIGITMPGPLEREKGMLLRVPNMELWDFFPIKDYFEKRFKCKVCLDNNSNATARAEEVYNKEVQGKSFLELTIDSGLGSGVILHLDNRSVSFDCEFGHICLDANGERCGCGNIGCAEMYASSAAVLKYAQRFNPELISWKIIADRFLAGDEICRKVVERERFYLSRVIISAVNCFAFDAVVFAGDIVYKFEDIFAQWLEETVSKESIKKKPLKMLTTQIKNAAIISAANLVADKSLYEPI